MALKAGRVGINKELVDEFGYLKEDAPSGEYYTKTQADNKFETKTHVNNNFQKKTLEVPIELLSGSALTVEGALQGLNEEKQNMTLEVPIELLSGSALTVESALQGLNEEKFDKVVQKELGAWNLLEYPYENTTKTVNGITFTDNGDGTVTANGTATANAMFICNTNGDFIEPDKKYYLHGCPEGGGVNTFKLQYTNNVDNTYIDVGEGTEITGFSTSYQQRQINIVIYSGKTVDNLIFKPVISLEPDDTYVPYAMPNKEITDRIARTHEEFTSESLGDIFNILKENQYALINTSGDATAILTNNDALRSVSAGYMVYNSVNDFVEYMIIIMSSGELYAGRFNSTAVTNIKKATLTNVL